MKILNITAQKPNSTGSGVYLSELLKEFHKMNVDLAVIAGIYRDDQPEFRPDIAFYPVYFNEGDLSFPIVGMSDEMPYKSTRYRDMNPEMVTSFKNAFVREVKKVIEEFSPNLIICHHLYLMTAAVREAFPEQKIYGFSHNTDIRQLMKTELERSYIIEQIRKLDHVFVLQEENKTMVRELFDIPAERITIVGGGFNTEIFYPPKDICPHDKKTVIFAGKISRKKGVESLVRSLAHIDFCSPVEFLLAGGTGNDIEYEEIKKIAESAKYPVRFLGKLPQKELAKAYRKSDVFVLPSFCEGLPLSAIEALACGCHVVMTDLPGVKAWIGQYVKNANVRFVPLPGLKNMDEPNEEDLPEFEKRLAKAIESSLQEDIPANADVSGLSWHMIAEKVLEI